MTATSATAMRLALVTAMACAPLTGVAATWINTAGGTWQTDANWSPANSPNTSGEDAAIETDGTYTVTVGTNTVTGNITVGTTTASGTQTLHQNNSSGLSYVTLTIGPRGIYNQQYNNSGTSTTIQNGGRLDTSSAAIRAIGGALNLQAGGTLEAKTGGGASFAASVTHTVNGNITGGGLLRTSGPGITLAGTGTIGGTGNFEFNNGVTLTGGLTISRPVVSPGVVVLIGDGLTVAFDNTFTQTGGTRSFGPQANGNTATVTGTGAISITANSGNTTSSTAIRFGGANSNNNGTGTLNVQGAGTLTLTSVASSGGWIDLSGGTLNLKRDTTISGDVRMFTNAAGVVNVTGAGNVLTMDSAGILSIENNTGDSRALRVNGSGSLLLQGGIISARNGTGNAAPLVIGETTSGTLELAAGTTSTFRRSTGGTGTDPILHLQSAATVTAGAGSVLTLDRAALRSDMTNVANWGLDTAGELRVASDLVTVEALVDDLGANVSLGSIGFAINKLSFADPGASFSLALKENTDNGGAGADRALYVGTLDLTSLSASRTLGLTGLSGNERVYYQTLVNPNNASFDTSKYIQLVPEPASLSLLAAAGALCVRRRRR